MEMPNVKQEARHLDIMRGVNSESVDLIYLDGLRSDTG